MEAKTTSPVASIAGSVDMCDEIGERKPNEQEFPQTQASMKSAINVAPEKVVDQKPDDKKELRDIPKMTSPDLSDCSAQSVDGRDDSPEHSVKSVPIKFTARRAESIQWLTRRESGLQSEPGNLAKVGEDFGSPKMLEIQKTINMAQITASGTGGLGGKNEVCCQTTFTQPGLPPGWTGPYCNRCHKLDHVVKDCPFKGSLNNRDRIKSGTFNQLQASFKEVDERVRAERQREDEIIRADVKTADFDVRQSRIAEERAMRRRWSEEEELMRARFAAEDVKENMRRRQEADTQRFMRQREDDERRAQRGDYLHTK